MDKTGVEERMKDGVELCWKVARQCNAKALKSCFVWGALC